jgi:uncharacterized protein
MTLKAPGLSGASTRLPIMPKLNWLCLVATLLAMLAWPAAPLQAAEGDLLAVPKLEKRVTDLTATLSSDDEARITARIREFEQKKGTQIAVLIVGSTKPEAIFDYSLRVAEAWKLGRKGVDDGVLFVVAKDDRKMQIITGPGVQGVMTDVVSRRIIAEVVAPRFREAKFADGIFNGVDKIASVIDGEALPPPPQKRQASKSSDSSSNFLFMAVFAAIFVAPILRSMLGRFIGASATGGITGLAAWWLAGGLLFPIVAGVIVFIVALLFGMSNFSRGGGGHIGGFGGGGWSSGGGGGGGSSDSFSGGGGGFDGGGASGDW